MSINVCNDRSMASITSLPSGVTGSSLVLISTQTASSSATIDFTSDIDSTYKEYIFKFIDVHPATDNVSFQFQADTGTNTNYNQTITSTFFRALHTEDDSTGAELGYQTALDLAQGTGFQTIAANIGNDNDQHTSGTIHLFDPSSTTFVKHFMVRNNDSVYINGIADIFMAGYFNTTTALTRVRFKMSSGNIDAGTIKMYGVV